MVTADGNACVFGRTHDFQNTLRLGRLWRQRPSLAKLSLFLGASASIDHRVPTVLAIPWERGIRDKCVRVSCSAGATAVVTESGVVYMLGNNRYGQCGVGSNDIYIWQPTALEEGLKDKRVVKVELGFQHAAAVTDEGEIYTWGKGERGQLGVMLDQDARHKVLPEKVDPADLQGQRVVDIACGFNSTLALTDQGQLFVWGKFQGESLDEKGFNYVDATRPRKVELPAALEEKIVKIWAGQFYFLAQDAKGCLWMWGMIPDAVSAKELREKAALDAPKVIPETEGMVESGVERTVHVPIPLEVSVDPIKEEQVFAGFDEFFVKSDDGIFSMDWNLSPSMIDYGVESSRIKTICPGWMHTLLILHEENGDAAGDDNT